MKGRWLIGAVLVLMMAVYAIPMLGAEGDLLTLSLGDSQPAVDQKLAALKRAGEIQFIADGLYQGKYLNRKAEFSLGFFDGKLYDIWIVFDGVAEADYDGVLGKMISEVINPALAKKLGDPATDYGLPELAEVGEFLIPAAEWDLKEKTVLSGVLQENGLYKAAIEIYDQALMAAKEDADQQSKGENGE